jgi:hypothetical protein
VPTGDESVLAADSAARDQPPCGCQPTSS